MPWCDRCTATTDKGCNQEVVIDLADSADEGSDTSKQDIEDGSAIIEGPESEAKMKDVASVEGADPPGNVEEINNVTPERQ